MHSLASESLTLHIFRKKRTQFTKLWIGEKFSLVEEKDKTTYTEKSINLL